MLLSRVLDFFQNVAFVSLSYVLHCRKTDEILHQLTKFFISKRAANLILMCQFLSEKIDILEEKSFHEFQRKIYVIIKRNST